MFYYSGQYLTPTCSPHNSKRQAICLDRFIYAAIAVLVPQTTWLRTGSRHYGQVMYRAVVLSKSKLFDNVALIYGNTSYKTHYSDVYVDGGLNNCPAPYALQTVGRSALNVWPPIEDFVKLCSASLTDNAIIITVLEFPKQQKTPQQQLCGQMVKVRKSEVNRPTCSSVMNVMQFNSAGQMLQLLTHFCSSSTRRRRRKGKK